MSRVNRSSLSSSNQDLAVLGANGQMLNNGSHVPISNSGTRILGHSRNASADLKWKPYNQQQVVQSTLRRNQSKEFFADPDRPIIAQPCICGLSCFTVFAFALFFVGLLTIIPPLVLSLGPQIRAHQEYLASTCTVLAYEIRAIQKSQSSCGLLPAVLTNATVGYPPYPIDTYAQETLLCYSFVPRMLVSRYSLRAPGNFTNNGTGSPNATTTASPTVPQPSLSPTTTPTIPPTSVSFNGSLYVIVSWAFRKVTDSLTTGGFDDFQQALLYAQTFQPDVEYRCWLDSDRVFMRVDLDSVFWTGMVIVIGVFVFCIVLPLLSWSIIAAKGVVSPDRLQKFAQRTIFSKCSRKDPDHLAQNDEELEVVVQPTDPSSDPLGYEKSSIELPLPTFTSSA